MTSPRRPLRLGALLAHALLLTGAAVFLLPFLWMVLTSFKPEADFFDARPLLIPSAFVGIEHYRKALTDVPLLRFMLNGALVCGCIVFMQLLIGLPCGYALAKLRFPGRAGLFVCVMVGIVVPAQVPAIPLYLGFARIGLLDSYAALILPCAVSALSIFLFRQFFLTVPDELIQAARLDGCNELSIVWRILLPSAWPAIGAFVIISIVAHWNDLYWPLVAIITPDLAPPALGVMYFRSQEMATSEYGALLAGGTMITAPLIVAFLIARRSFMRGITMTGPV